MNRRHYKEIFQDAYDEALENGESDDAAGQIGLDAISDHWAAKADDAKDRRDDSGAGL